MTDLGLGGYPIPENLRVGVDGARNIRIVARPWKEHFWSTNQFWVVRVEVAVELMRLCGLERKGYFEMWAEVFRGEGRIGFLWLEQGMMEPWSEEEGVGVGNGTVGG